MKVYTVVSYRMAKDFEIVHVFRTRKNAHAVAEGIANSYAQSKTGLTVLRDGDSYNVMRDDEAICWTEVVTRELHD